jgi:protein-L-isoaspartate(D-aspartate) O-methyltransferase
MAVAGADGFAYVLQRPAGSDESGKALIELGACGYGPGGPRLASAIAGQVAAWAQCGASLSDLWVEVHPAGTAGLPDAMITAAKRNSTVLVRAE